MSCLKHLLAKRAMETLLLPLGLWVVGPPVHNADPEPHHPSREPGEGEAKLDRPRQLAARRCPRVARCRRAGDGAVRTA